MEKIIKLQRVVPISQSGKYLTFCNLSFIRFRMQIFLYICIIDSTCSSYLSRVQQYDHFVKFRDQSYWHCNWIPGSTLISMHPSLVRNFHRLHRTPIEEADIAFENSGEGGGERVDEPKLPSSDDDSADDSGGDEPGSNPIVGGKLFVQ